MTHLFRVRNWFENILLGRTWGVRLCFIFTVIVINDLFFSPISCTSTVFFVYKINYLLQSFFIPLKDNFFFHKMPLRKISKIIINKNWSNKNLVERASKLETDWVRIFYLLLSFKNICHNLGVRHRDVFFTTSLTHSSRLLLLYSLLFPTSLISMLTKSHTH